MSTYFSVHFVEYFVVLDTDRLRGTKKKSYAILYFHTPERITTEITQVTKIQNTTEFIALIF